MRHAQHRHAVLDQGDHRFQDLLDHFSIFTGGAGFAVNILSSRRMDVSRHVSSKLEDKFADSAWTREPTARR
ncbi:hypothetical protein J5277_30780 [Rhizobium sp. 16-449-1b]|uniref:hypothetical protein n=1 Tax=Rhizobium sp. 16-449-1b TaxID=2819989 RepID=UPI000A89BD76|nr:hypothetical protein [Rhizobium sp. 16-449-1b]MBO9198512.1 hypothetical protein [Rhizobium sp. 16-449-1b]